MDEQIRGLLNQSKSCNKMMKEQKKVISELKKGLTKCSESTENLSSKSKDTAYVKKEMEKMSKGMAKCGESLKHLEIKFEACEKENKELERMNKRLLNSKCDRVFASLGDENDRLKETIMRLMEQITLQQELVVRLKRRNPSDEVRRTLLLKQNNTKLRSQLKSKSEDILRIKTMK
jgi:septal ring factor EnvC (AmiA/AmiB activator)